MTFSMTFQGILRWLGWYPLCIVASIDLIAAPIVGPIGETPLRRVAR